MEIKELKQGTIYKYIYSKMYLISECIENSTKKVHGYLSVANDKIEYYTWSNTCGTSSSVILATEEEKQWYLACKKANKFIEKEEALKSFKQETKFIEGKWYKSKMGNYYKFLKLEFNKWWSSEEILSGSYNKINDDRGPQSWINGLVEIPLSEIQAYLPEGHVDKIKKEVLVQTGFNQQKACATCKYNYNCKKAPHAINGKLCSAINGQHYPKENIIKQELTSLPEKWCIKRNTSQNTLVTDYINRTYNTYYFDQVFSDDFYYSNGNHGSQIYGTEITFDQFKKWVLKENVEEIPIKKEELMDLIAEAKKRYPVGTEYYGIKHGKKIKALYEPTLRTTGHYSGIKEGVVGIEVSEDYVYLDGVWAEIISEAKQPECEWVGMSKPSSFGEQIDVKNIHQWSGMHPENHLAYLGGIDPYEECVKPQVLNITIKKSKVQQVEVVPLQKPCIISTRKSKFKLQIN